jgi:hypothetical protein
VLEKERELKSCWRSLSNRGDVRWSGLEDVTSVDFSLIAVLTNHFD